MTHCVNFEFLYLRKLSMLRNKVVWDKHYYSNRFTVRNIFLLRYRRFRLMCTFHIMFNCILIPFCNFYTMWTSRQKASKMSLCENKDICMNIHCSCLVKLDKSAGFNLNLYSNLYIFTNISEKKEFRCISDKIIALITMYKYRIFVILIC